MKFINHARKWNFIFEFEKKTFGIMRFIPEGILGNSLPNMVVVLLSNLFGNHIVSIIFVDNTFSKHSFMNLSMKSRE